MEKTLKQKVYDFYKEKEGEYTEENLEKSMERAGFEKTEIEEAKEYWREIKQIDTDFNREKTIPTFGIELEYGGYDTSVTSELIEDTKDDGSVQGDGLEINLFPVKNTEENIKEFKAKAKKMMERAEEGNCIVHPSAGMHVHVSSTSLGWQEGTNIVAITRNIFEREEFTGIKWDDSESRYVYKDEYEDEYTYVDKEEYERMINEGYDDEYLMIRIDGKARLKIKNENEIDEKYKKQFEWIKFLYSISEREGFEGYGLGRDITRGYTGHRTIELRVWRTTLDYRKLTARATIAMFWIYFVNKHIRLIHKGYKKYKDVDIWEELKKDEKAYDAYKYLAFCYTNHHDVGYTEQEIINKLGMTSCAAKAIKELSRIEDYLQFDLIYKEANDTINNA